MPHVLGVSDGGVGILQCVLSPTLGASWNFLVQPSPHLQTVMGRVSIKPANDGLKLRIAAHMCY
jgi:hypothetical protein